MILYTRFFGVVSLAAFLVVSPFASAQQFKALLFTKTEGWYHDSQPQAVDAVQELSRLHNFALEVTGDASAFNRENLETFDVVIFLLTTGDVLNDDQQGAFRNFIRKGRGFVGVHSASDTEYGWPWYKGLVGRSFSIHPAVQTAKLHVVDKSFPGLEFMPSRFLWTDEYYEFGPEKSDHLNYLLTVDEASYSPQVDWGEVKSEGMGDFHPIAWYQNYDGGRSFYTGLGHLSASYQSPFFLSHLYGGIYWAAMGLGIEISKNRNPQ